MITDLDREIHRRYKQDRKKGSFADFNDWSFKNKLSCTEIRQSIDKVEKQITILIILWCATIVGVIATICYTLPYLWPELYD